MLLMYLRMYTTQQMRGRAQRHLKAIQYLSVFARLQVDVQFESWILNASSSCCQSAAMHSLPEWWRRWCPQDRILGYLFLPS